MLACVHVLKFTYARINAHLRGRLDSWAHSSPVQLNDMNPINLTASLFWTPPAGHCPPPWPPGLRIEWSCIWRGRPCEASAQSLATVMAEANVVDGAAAVPASWSGWESTLSLQPETLAPSLSPYVFSATIISAGNTIGGRPLLRRELAVYVEHEGNGSAGEYDDGGGPMSPLRRRRTMLDGVAGLRLTSRQDASELMSPETYMPPVNGPQYALRLATAGASGWAVEASESQPPVSGQCHLWWDGWEASGLLMGALLECGSWIGRDADAYPLSYEFGLQYRYACT